MVIRCIGAKGYQSELFKKVNGFFNFHRGDFLIQRHRERFIIKRVVFPFYQFTDRGMVPFAEVGELVRADRGDVGMRAQGGDKAEIVIFFDSGLCLGKENDIAKVFGFFLFQPQSFGDLSRGFLADISFVVHDQFKKVRRSKSEGLRHEPVRKSSRVFFMPLVIAAEKSPIVGKVEY